MSVCLRVCVSLLPIYALMYMFAPTSRNRMSKIFRDSESLGKSSGKKWSQNRNFYSESGLKLPRKKKFFLYWFCLILCGRTGVEPILLHVWSPKNGGWVQSIHRPRVDPSCGRADAWTRGRVDASTALFFLDKSRKLPKIVLVLQSASVERFDVSRKRDF